MSKQVVNVKGYVQLKDDPDCLYIMPYVYKDNEHVYVINGDGNVVLMGYNLLLMVSTNRAEGDMMVEAVRSHDHACPRCRDEAQVLVFSTDDGFIVVNRRTCVPCEYVDWVEVDA